MEKKYEMTDESMVILHGSVSILHRIRALKDFGDVKRGDLGGWIKSRNNLSQSGNAWVYDDAKVYGNAIVHEDAKLYDNVKVYDNAKVSRNTKLSGCIEVCGWAELRKDANILSTNDVLCIGPIGSRNGHTTFYKGLNNSIMVSCGCFNDTIDKFEEQVKETHKDNELYLNQYLDAIEFAKKRLA